MKFKKEYLQECARENTDVIINEIVEHGRWTLTYEIIFRFEDKFYRSFYQRGATENQDESPYEFDEDNIECEEVYAMQVLVTQYKSIEELLKGI